MIIMALDHVRDLLHVDALSQQPTDLGTTTPVLFFTRWITHFCAPIFVCLAGVSAFLALHNNPDRKKQEAFLRRRGAVLILLEFTVMNFGLFFDPAFHVLIFSVIAAIGLGLIALSYSSRLSWTTVGCIGLVIVLGHNLFALLPPGDGSALRTVLTPLFGPAAFPLGGRTFLMAYPPIPWLGIMMVGYAAGHYFLETSGKRQRVFWRASGAAILLFLLLRTINVYGDPAPWGTQKNSVYTFLSFLNVTKYPPSLLFTLVTLSGMFAFLAMMERWQEKLLATGATFRQRLMEILKVYGKVPLFYFMVHFYLIHVILLVVLLAQGFSWSQLEFTTGTFGRPRQIPSGINLWMVYAIWIVVVALLYKPCQWFAGYKSRNKKGWVKYV